MEMEDPSVHRFGALAQIVVPVHRPRGASVVKTVLRAHGRKAAPGCLRQEDLAGDGGLGLLQLVSRVRSSSRAINGFGHRVHAHTVPYGEDCAFHSEWLRFRHTELGSDG